MFAEMYEAQYDPEAEKKREEEKMLRKQNLTKEIESRCENERKIIANPKSSPQEQSLAYAKIAKEYAKESEMKEEALECWKKACFLDRNNVDFKIQKTFCLSDDEAEKQLNSLVEIYQDNARVYEARALWKFRNGKISTQDFKKALELDPNFASATLERTQTLVTLGLDKEAVEEGNKLLQQNPHCKEAYIMQGMAYRSLKQFDKVVIVYELKNLLDQSVKALNSALEIDPQCSISLAEEAYTFYLMQDYDKALELCEASLAVRDVRVYIACCVKADVLYKKGRLEESFQILQDVSYQNVEPWYQECVVSSWYQPYKYLHIELYRKVRDELKKQSK